MKISLSLSRFALVLMGLISCGAGSVAKEDGAADAMRIGGSAGSLTILALLVGEADIVQSLSPDMRPTVKAALSRDGMHVAIADKASAASRETTPSALALAQGTYPPHKNLLQVTSAHANPLIGQSVAFMRLTAGQALLEQNGHQARAAK